MNAYVCMIPKFKWQVLVKKRFAGSKIEHGSRDSEKQKGHGPVDVVVLGEAEVVVGQGGDEDDGLDLVETPNPLLAFRPLAADVEQTERQSLSFESMVTRRLLKFNYSRYSSAI